METHQRETVPGFFLQARQKSHLKLALVWLSMKVEGKNACRIGISVSNKKQGVGVMWRGNNGGES